MIAEDFQPQKNDILDYYYKLRDAFNNEFEGREYATLARLKESFKYFTLLLANVGEVRQPLLRSQSLGELMNCFEQLIQRTPVENFDFYGNLGLMKSGNLTKC